ncbi:Transposable element P transposase, partial [Aphis craccivora]
MSIKKLVSYNSKNDLFSGFEDFEDNSIVNLKSIKYCDQALVVMIKGLTTPWKQVIGYFFSSGPVKGYRLKQIVARTITKLKEIGLIPKVVVCDQGTNNLCMRNLFGVTETKPYIHFEGEKIYFFHDSPHLIKSVRNNFKKYNFSIDEEVYSWQDLVTFYNLDKNKTLRLAPKLKNIHMELPPFSPMRVCLATQTLSHTVSSGILTLVALNKLRSKATYTAKFISFFDSLFDIFNSITYNEPKLLRRPLTKDSCHWEFLKNADKFLNNLKIHNKSGKQPPCIKGWRENINALKFLYEELNTEYSIEFLLTRRLTQDCIENVFSIIRAKGGNNTTPDATKFQSAIRMLMCNNLLTPSEEGNCEMDACQFLTKLNELKTIRLQVNSFNTWDNTIENDEDMYNNILDVHLSSTNINSILMDPHNTSAVAYVTGWACSKLEHPECIKQLATKNKSNTAVFNPCTTFIEMKEYENSDLLYPYDSTIDFCKRMTCLFKENIQKMLLESKTN